MKSRLPVIQLPVTIRGIIYSGSIGYQQDDIPFIAGNCGGGSFALPRLIIGRRRNTLSEYDDSVIDTFGTETEVEEGA